jgi:hypothetical protein
VDVGAIVGVAVRGGQRKPFVGLNQILGHALAQRTGNGQVVLGAAETAFSRFAKSIRGGGIILRRALASSIRPR